MDITKKKVPRQWMGAMGPPNEPQALLGCCELAAQCGSRRFVLIEGDLQRSLREATTSLVVKCLSLPRTADSDPADCEFVR